MDVPNEQCLCARRQAPSKSSKSQAQSENKVKQLEIRRPLSTRRATSTKK